jgi:O-antigen ligase
LGVNRQSADVWCERAILGSVLGILVLGPLALGAVRPATFIIIQALTICVMALWAARLWLSSKPQLLWPPIGWLVIGFTLYAIFRYRAADIEYVARQELLHVLVYCFLFLAVLNNLHRQERMQALTVTLVFLAMAISFYAIFQYLTGWTKVWGMPGLYGHRGTGTYFNPDHLAGFLELVLPLGLGLTLVSRLSPVARIFLGYASLCILAGIAVTLSRGGWLSTSLALLFFFGLLSFRRGYRLPALAFLAVIVIGCVVLVPRSRLFVSRATQLVEGGRLNEDMRFTVWQAAYHIWQENIWWGAGPGHFNYRYREFRAEDVQKQPEKAHNDFLNTLADWGLTGGILVGGTLVLLAIGIFKAWSFVHGSPRDLGGKTGSNRFALLLGGAMGLLALFFHSGVDFNMQVPANAITAIVLMALLSSHLRFASERYWVSVKTWMKPLVTFVLAAGMAYLGWQSWRGGQEQRWLRAARRAPLYSDEQIACLKRAFAAEPMNDHTAVRIGEAERRQSQEGGRGMSEGDAPNYRALAEEATGWFDTAARLNRWEVAAVLGAGWCLDWLERSGESGKYFSRAEELDPKGYFTLSNIGLHYTELGDYAAAQQFFERSYRLESNDPIARNYLQICQTRLLEAATNDIAARLQQRR